MTVFGLPPGVRYAELFAKGFWERFGDLNPEAVPRIDVLVNSRRALRVLSDALAARGGARLLPRFRVVGELGADPLLAPDLPPAVDPMRRQLRLTRLVEKFLDSQHRAGSARAAPLSAAPELARSLAGLLDECDEAGIETAKLDNAAEGEHAEHWDRNLRFLDIVRESWPKIAEEEEGGAMGPKARQRAVILRLIEGWKRAPPPDPVVFAGSTGSVASTAMLMAAVARLENGAVLLPGIDRALDSDIWESVAAGDAPEHPQAPFVGLLGKLGLTPRDARPWSRDRPREARRRLLAQAMRPAPVTDAWHARAEELSADLDEAVAGVALLEAPTPRHEAGAVALAVRRALETPGKTVLILTSDAALARRISAELGRFGIEPDDSLGRLLAQSPPAVFLRLIVELAEGRAGAVEIAALLSHPLTAVGGDRAAHRRHASAYERAVLRRRGAPSGAGLPDWAEADGERAAWFAALSAALDPLVRALARRDPRAPLADIVRAHIAAAEALGGAHSGESEIWATEAGREMRGLMERLTAAADAFDDGPVEHDDKPVEHYYGRLLADLMRNREIRRPGRTAHPRVALMGPRESRVASADLVILAGLNEGRWPQSPGADPWLSRPMRVALGLPPPERVVGLAAHDFLQAAMAPEVVLSRSVREDGGPATPSRWLTRLESLIDGLDRLRGGEPATIPGLKDRGGKTLDDLVWTHRPDAELCAALPRAPRPEPRPPAAARPRRLSVTTVERLVRDPYAVYARRVLNLSPLDPLGDAPDFRDRGSTVHKILERFAGETRDALPDDAAERLGRIADAVLAEDIAVPALRRIWRARVARFADWFLEGERERRDAGAVEGIEVAGRMDVPGLPGFAITARADRIDRLNSGEAAIYDYKAGAPPTRPQIENGFNHQLHLQAAILEAGGFEGLPAMKTRTGEYIGLTGSGEGGKTTTVSGLSSKLDEADESGKSKVAQRLDEATKLLTAYAREETPFLPRRMVERRGYEGDYDHLSRHGEWEDGDG